MGKVSVLTSVQGAGKTVQVYDVAHVDSLKALAVSADTRSNRNHNRINDLNNQVDILKKTVIPALQEDMEGQVQTILDSLAALPSSLSAEVLNNEAFMEAVAEKVGDRLEAALDLKLAAFKDEVRTLIEEEFKH